MRKKEIKRILFYTGIPRNFRTTLISHLYEVSQVYPVVLLSEDLGDDLKKIIEDKKIFPKIEKIISVRQYSRSFKNVFEKNRDLKNTAEKAINDFKPDIVMAPYDIFLFEMYLMRFAKRSRAITFALQESNVLDIATRRKNVDLINVYLRFPDFLPFFIRYFLVQCRKYLGHMLYYWVLPISVGKKPFSGSSSFILRRGLSGMRDANYQVVFSKRDYDIHARAGVPLKKLYILSHPLARKTKDFFKKVLFKENNQTTKENILTLLFPVEEFSFKVKDYSLIPDKKREEKRLEIVKLISETLKDWTIYIKPHPLTKNFEEIKKLFGFKNVKVVNPSEPIDKYIRKARVVAELPKSMSTVLFTASLLYPEKAIISLDPCGELGGDIYKEIEGVEYINSLEDLKRILELIKSNKFKKEIKLESKRGFESLIELIDHLVLEI